MKMRFFSTLLILLAVIWSSESARAWSLKTHLWIAQQVINDVIDDCKITLNLRDGRVMQYAVPPEVCGAIKANPQMYRAGHLGPDIFPDPVSGQMTTHPGVENGWSTERWLRKVVEAANGPDELAIAYGFLGHAAGDIFAHTYVNQYAGDIFLLTDGETKTELRHFSLEKYIESKTPALPFGVDAGGIKVPAKYLSQQLIYDGDVARQYRKVPVTLHLASLNAAKEAVDGISDVSRKITDKLIDFYAGFYKLQLREIAKIATFEHEVEAAKAALRAAELALDAERAALNLARKAVDEAQEIIEKNPEIINALTGQISVTLNLISEASGLVGSLSAAKQKAVDDLNAAQQKLTGLVCGVKEKVCHTVTDTICEWAGPLKSLCKKVENEVCGFVDKSDPLCGPAKDVLDQAISILNKATSDLEQAVAKQTQLLARKAALEAEKVEREVKLAAARLAFDGLRLALDAHEKLNELKGKGVEEARKVVEFADEKLKEVRKAAEPIFKLVDSIADVMKEYNSLSLFFKNWKDGIERAGEDFIDASMSTGFTMINEDGKGMEHYQRWLQCSALNYLGVPWQLPFAFCEVKDKITEIKDKIEEFKDSLPPVVQWLIDPLGELKQEAIKVAKKEVWKAAKDAADFVVGPPTGRFIGMLASQEHATADAVRGIFRDPGDTNGKKVLVFDDVIKLVDEDIGLSGGVLNPQTFHALRNAVTLSKLSLLDANELNRLYQDIAGNMPTRYGPTLYEDQVGKRFSLLFYAVRSIDGNHQWQPFGLPYLRSDKHHGPANPELRRYGHSVHDNPFDGFRLFQDPIGRELVFLQLFTGPVEGNMAKIPEAQAPGYPYPACERNPFPRTVDDLGHIMYSDPGCSGGVAKLGPKAPKAKMTAFVPDRKKVAESQPKRKKPKVRAVACNWEGFGSDGAPSGVRVSIVAYKTATIRDFARHPHRCSWGNFGGNDANAAGWWNWHSVEVPPRVRRSSGVKRVRGARVYRPRPA